MIQIKPRPGLAAAAMTLLLLAASGARAHQCVDVEIVRAPDSATLGAFIAVEGAATNCGDPARGFVTTWTLVSEDGNRIHLLRRAVVQVHPGRTVTGVSRLMIPRDVRPGIYQIVLTGAAPSGFTESDAVRIEITRHR